MSKSKYKELYNSDMERYNNSFGGGGHGPYIRRFHKYFRKCQTEENPLLLLYYRFRFKCLKEKHAIEIYPRGNIGKGFHVVHPYNITISSMATLGDNIDIHKGATIGREFRGKRNGAPTIGNCVWIGINATIVGNVKIGNDVLIAPAAYVNCDVPDHSVVLGNPCIIKHKDEATKGYITRPV